MYTYVQYIYISDYFFTNFIGLVGISLYKHLLQPSPGPTIAPTPLPTSAPTNPTPIPTRVPTERPSGLVWQGGANLRYVEDDNGLEMTGDAGQCSGGRGFETALASYGGEIDVIATFVLSLADDVYSTYILHCRCFQFRTPFKLVTAQVASLCCLSTVIGVMVICSCLESNHSRCLG